MLSSFSFCSIVITLAFFAQHSDCSEAESSLSYRHPNSNYFGLEFQRARYQDWNAFIDAYYLSVDDVVAEVFYPENSVEQFEWYVNSKPYANATKVLRINAQEYKALYQEYPKKIGVKSTNYYTRKFVRIVDISSITRDEHICLFREGVFRLVTPQNCLISGYPPPRLTVNSLEKLYYHCHLPDGIYTINFLTEGMGGDYKSRLGRLDADGKVVERIGIGPNSEVYTPPVITATDVTYVCLIVSKDGTFEAPISPPLTVNVQPLTESNQQKMELITNLLSELETRAVVSMGVLVPSQLIVAAGYMKTLTIPSPTLAEDLLRVCLRVMRLQDEKLLIGEFALYLEIITVGVQRMTLSTLTVGYAHDLLMIIASVIPMLAPTFIEIINVCMIIQEKLGLNINEWILKVIYDAMHARLFGVDLHYPPKVSFDSPIMNAIGTLSYTMPEQQVIGSFGFSPSSSSTSTSTSPFVTIMSSPNQPVDRSTSRQLNAGTDIVVVNFSCQNASKLSCSDNVIVSSRIEKRITVEKLEGTSSTSCVEITSKSSLCPVSIQGISTYRITVLNEAPPASAPEGNAPKEDDDAKRDSVISTRNYIRVIVCIVIITCFIFFIILITVKLILCIRNRRRAAPLRQNTNAREPTYEVEVQSNDKTTTVSIRCAKTPNPKSTFQVESPHVKKCKTPIGNQSNTNPYL